MAGAGAGTIYPACLPTALKWFPGARPVLSPALCRRAHPAAPSSCRPLPSGSLTPTVRRWPAASWAGRCAQRPLQGKWKIRRRDIYTALKLCYTISDRPVGQNERERSYAEIQCKKTIYDIGGGHTGAGAGLCQPDRHPDRPAPRDEPALPAGHDHLPRCQP